MGKGTDCRQPRRIEKEAIVAAPKKSGEPGIMEKEASILAAPKRWECILGPAVNKGMLQMTVVGSPFAMTKLMMDSFKEGSKARDLWNEKPYHG